MPDTIKQEPVCQFSRHGRSCKNKGFHHYQDRKEKLWLCASHLIEVSFDRFGKKLKRRVMA